MSATVTRYRVMAYIVGVLFNALVFIGLPLKYLAGQRWVAAGWTAHGFVYMVYLLAAFMLTRQLRLRAGHTLIVLLAGTIPVMTFVVERWVTRRWLSPSRPDVSARGPASPGTLGAGAASASPASAAAAEAPSGAAQEA